MRVDDGLVSLPAAEGARAVALALLAEATGAAEALSAGTGAEPLHDFRVALRRLRSTFRSYRPWLRGDLRRDDERRLRKVARSTNEARDAEVQLAWLAGQRDAFRSGRRRPGFDLLVARYAARVHGAPDAARTASRLSRTAERIERRLGAGDRALRGPRSGASFGAVLASLLRERVDALAERIQAIRGASDQEGVHAARIEGKRLRYLAEPLRGYRPADATPAVARLKRLQDLLGDLHDAHVLAAELRDALVDCAAERARRAHEAAYGDAKAARGARPSSRSSPRPGLLALTAVARERCDALFHELEREWRGGGLDALLGELRSIAAALEARATGRRRRGGGRRRRKPPAC